MSNSKSTIRWVTVAVLLLAAGTMPAVADMARASPAQGYRVALSDLDLRTASGVETLYGRLQAAARVVCGFAQARGYADRSRARRCVSATLDAEVAELARAGLRPARKMTNYTAVAVAAQNFTSP